MGSNPRPRKYVDQPPESLSPYQAMVRSLSQRLVEAQRPIRILDAVRWNNSIELSFLNSGGTELPRVTRDTYLTRPLSYSITQKREEFRSLEADVRLYLGTSSSVGKILIRMSEEYRQVLDLLEARGTSSFAGLSRRLYGSGSERNSHGSIRLAEMAQAINRAFIDIARNGNPVLEEDPLGLPRFTASETAAELSCRLEKFFGKPGTVRVQLSGDILADAAAGCDYLKIREGAFFTALDIRLLEVHEGWVHLGTTLNGQSQPISTFLSKGPPSSATTQEGLAVLTEVLSDVCHPARIRRLLNRVAAIDMAESGADFLQVYRFYQEEGYDPRDAYHQAVRVFRGSLPAGQGPFTKDLSYIRGFVQVATYLKKVLKSGRYGVIPLLFTGKTNLEDMEILQELSEEGLINKPHYLPPPYTNTTELYSRLLGTRMAPITASLDTTYGNLVGLP